MLASLECLANSMAHRVALPVSLAFTRLRCTVKVRGNLLLTFGALTALTK